MGLLAQQKCLHHEAREAVCRCPSCRNFFCRECVAFFEARLLCAACLARAAGATGPDDTKRWPSAMLVALGASGLLLVWLLFYFAGWMLVQARPSAPIASIAPFRMLA